MDPVTPPTPTPPHWKIRLTTVTPVSKGLAMVVMVALPFIGFYLGVLYSEEVQREPSDMLKGLPSLPPNPPGGGRPEVTVAKEKTETSADGKVKITALKEGKQVVVWINGATSSQLTYEELVEVDDSGNYWSGLKPSAALSPNGNFIAYSDTSGLHLYDIQKGSTSSLILYPPQNPTAESQLTGAALNLRWSPNNRYILYGIPYYEGSGLGIIDTATGNHASFETAGSAIDATWVMENGVTYVVTSSEGDGEYAMEPGLHVATIPPTIAAKIPFKNLFPPANSMNDLPSKTIGVTSFLYDPLTKRIGFEFHRNGDFTKTYHGSVNLDGTNFVEGQ